MFTFKDLNNNLIQSEDPVRADHAKRFFKTGVGEYGEGDIFLGLTNPECRNLAKKFYDLPYFEVQKALNNKYHEARLIGLLILVKRFQKEGEVERKQIYNLYLKNTKRINNWDLVDLTAGKIVGPYLENKDKSILYQLAKSKLLWERRISIISTSYYIGKGDPKDALKIAEILLTDKEDLIHKAVGWMLREIGKRCSIEAEEEFLKKHSKKMPRTMLRYAIERFPEKKRQQYLLKS